MKFEITKSINAPLERTFEVFSDIENAQQRLSDITNIEFMSDMRSGEGTEWKETRIMFGKEATELMKITKFEKNAMYQVETETSGATGYTKFDFVQDGDGTEVTMTFWGVDHTLMAKLMGIFSFFMVGTIKKMMDKDLEDLKKYLENEN